MKQGVEFDLEEEIQSPASMKLRPHDSGLTAILPLPGPNVLAPATSINLIY